MRRTCQTLTRRRGVDGMASLEFEIRDHVARYLNGDIPIDEFRDWLVSRTWDVERCGHPGVIDLVGEIELAYAELANGHRTEDEFRSLLRPMVSDYACSVPAHGSSVTVKTESSSITAPVRYAGGYIQVVAAHA